MKSILIAIFMLSFPVTVMAGDDWVASGSAPGKNITFKYNKASIEVLSKGIVRALVRVERTDYSLPMYGFTPRETHYAEFVQDIDCQNTRFKSHREKYVQLDGSYIMGDDVPVPVYQGADKGTLSEGLISAVCKNAGIKLR